MLPLFHLNNQLHMEMAYSIMSNNEINISKEAARPKFVEA
jgi:hypothetical protein